MDPTTLGLTLAFAQLIIQYGIPVAIDLLTLWKAEHDGNITYEKVMLLLEDLKAPDTYFTE